MLSVRNTSRLIKAVRDVSALRSPDKGDLPSAMDINFPLMGSSL